MTPYFVWTTRKRPTKAQAARIQKAVRQLDSEMDFVGPVDIPGNETHAWLERPNDGTNSANFRRATNRQCVEVAERVLG